MKQLFLLPIIFSFLCSNAQDIAILKYGGGGDWYANPTALPNLIAFTNKTIGTSIAKNSKTVDIGSEAIFDFPMVFMTGHGNVSFSDTETQNLKKYLISGGFLHISDNYGMDAYVKREFKKVFPELKFIEIHSTHSIYNQTYKFPNGIPKIHEHDGNPPEGLGLFYKGKLVCFYDYESDLSDGWEDSTVHNNPMETRIKALQMGSNIIEYAFKN